MELIYHFVKTCGECAYCLPVQPTVTVSSLMSSAESASLSHGLLYWNSRVQGSPLMWLEAGPGVAKVQMRSPGAPMSCLPFSNSPVSGCLLYVSLSIENLTPHVFLVISHE